MRSPLPYLALAFVLLCAATLVRGQQALVAVDFSKAEPTQGAVERLEVGAVTLLSNQPSLQIVKLEDGSSALQVRHGKGAWVRASFAPTLPKTKSMLVLKAEIKFPKGAPDKGGSLRMGMYAVKDADGRVASAEDQGFMVLTNPGAPEPRQETKTGCDTNKAGADGKYAGFLGGGSGTRGTKASGPTLAFGKDWTPVAFALEPKADKPSSGWSLTALLGSQPVKFTEEYRAAPDVISPAFNVAGINITTGDAMLVRNLVVIEAKTK